MARLLYFFFRHIFPISLHSPFLANILLSSISLSLESLATTDLFLDYPLAMTSNGRCFEIVLKWRGLRFDGFGGANAWRVGLLACLLIKFQHPFFAPQLIVYQLHRLDERNSRSRIL